MNYYKYIISVLTGCILMSVTSFSYADSRKSFIKKYKHIAIQEMKRTGIPASISLAQGILESGCGLSELAIKANNYFGIKCHNWQGATYTMDDDTKNECFRKYRNAEESWLDHSDFLTSRPRYAALFKLKSTDYRAWAKGLKAAGYATNPKYAELLIKIIEEEELHKYDDASYRPSKNSNKEHSITIDELEKTIAYNSSSYKERIKYRNGIPYLEVQSGDSFQKIADYYEMDIKKLMKYNDKTNTILRPGDIVYIKAKKSRAARGYEVHHVTNNDTPYSISQQYGIKLKKLCNNNYINAEDKLLEGEIIYLRKKAILF